MAIDIRYDKELKILIATCHGSLTLDQLQQVFTSIVHSSDYPPDVSTLWDCRAMEFKQLEKGFEEKIIQLRSQHPERREARIAIVVVGELNYGLTRMYEMKSMDLPQQIMVFKEIESAVAWLHSGVS